MAASRSSLFRMVFTVCVMLTILMSYYNLSSLKWTVQRFLHVIEGRKDVTFQQKLVVSTKDKEYSKFSKQLDLSKTTLSEVYCSFNWNFNLMGLQSYEEGANSSHIEQMKITDDTQALFPNPSIVLNPNKFLLPALASGPNNQLVGLRETVFTAIVLNRTFVIPIFKKHEFDKQKTTSPFIAPFHRVDIESLCKYVSCITIYQFKQKCNDRVDAVMNTRNLDLGQIRGIERTNHLRILPPATNDTSLMSNILLPLNATSEKNKKLLFTSQEIKKYFHSQEMCMIFPFPFLNLRSAQRKNLHEISDVEMKDVKKTEDVRLMISIMRHSQHPEYLKNISKAFQKHFMGGRPFLSAHWRYNAIDYLSSLKCAHTQFRIKLCDVARNFTNEDIANRIEEKVESLKASNITVKIVYIASPRSERMRISAVAKLLTKKTNVCTFTSIDLEKFMQRYYDCEFLNKHSEDIMSTVEMEICASGIAFIGSDGSWSGNVRNARLFSEDPVVDTSRNDFFVVPRRAG